MSDHSFAFVVDDGSREKVAEVQEDDPAAEGEQVKGRQDQCEEDGDPGVAEEDCGGVSEGSEHGCFWFKVLS